MRRGPSATGRFKPSFYIYIYMYNVNALFPNLCKILNKLPSFLQKIVCIYPYYIYMYNMLTIYFAHLSKIEFLYAAVETNSTAHNHGPSNFLQETGEFIVKSTMLLRQIQSTHYIYIYRIYTLQFFSAAMG